MHRISTSGASEPTEVGNTKPIWSDLGELCIEWSQCALSKTNGKMGDLSYFKVQANQGRLLASAREAAAKVEMVHLANLVDQIEDDLVRADAVADGLFWTRDPVKVKDFVLEAIQLVDRARFGLATLVREVRVLERKTKISRALSQELHTALRALLLDGIRNQRLALERSLKTTS